MQIKLIMEENKRMSMPSSGERIAAYFEQLFKKYGSNGSCLFLPSIMSLAKKLDCPAVDVHSALKSLTDKGFYFLVLGLDTPVTLWYPLNRQAG